MDKRILDFVKKVRGRLRGQVVVDSLLVSVTGGLCIAVLISILSIFISMYYAIPAAAGVVLFSLFVGLILGIRKTPSLEQAALMADSRGHKEKIITALGLIGRDDAFGRLQKSDACKEINGFRINKEFPIKLSWKKGLVFVILAIIFGVTAGLDSPARRNAVTAHEVKKESLNEIAKLEKIKKQLDKTDGLSG